MRNIFKIVRLPELIDHCRICVDVNCYMAKRKVNPFYMRNNYCCKWQPKVKGKRK